MSSVGLDDFPAVQFAHRLVDAAQIESLLQLVEVARRDPSLRHAPWPEFDRDLVLAGINRSDDAVLQSLWSGLFSRLMVLHKP